MIGTGFILLAVVWVVSILLCLVCSRWESRAVYVGILCILVAAICTVVLGFFPREKAPVEPYVIYDYTYVYRTVLVSLLGIMLFVGVIVVAVFHVFDQRRATPVKPWSY